MVKAVIIGGGIAGLACAVALGRAGVEVDVFERQDRFAEIGAGIQLAANSFRALDYIGVAQDVIERAVPVRNLAVRDGLTGDPLVQLTTDADYTRTFGYPYMVVHRKDIHQALLNAARIPGVRLHASSPVEGFCDTGGAVLVRVTGRAARLVVSDVLIGADGIRSTVREQLLNDGPAALCGHTIYRSVIDMTAAPGDIRRDYTDLHTTGIPVTLWAGTDWHLVNYPIAGGQQLNLAITHHDGDISPASGVPADRTQVAAVPAAADRRVHALLAAGRNWRRWTLADREPVRRWSIGRTVLIGDAAHPMLQYAAQGAGMAIEDAVLLARILSHPTGGETVAKQLERFTAERADRTAAVRTLAVELGRQVYHCTARPRQERNRWLSAHTDHQVREMVRWLHGSTTFTDTPTGHHVAERKEAMP